MPMKSSLLLKKLLDIVKQSVSVFKMDLSCGENLENSGNSNGERPDVCIAGTDPALDRNPHLLTNLLALERFHGLHTDYFQHVQIDIQPFMRKVVTVWMLEVCEEQRCEEQVFSLAVSYLDRFLAQVAISRKQLQLLAVTALLVASKFRQCHALSIDLLCAYTDNSILPQEVRQWELMLVQRLNWQLSIATAFDFVDPILARVPWGRTNPLVRIHAITLSSVCYTETELLLVPPSLIAVACITAAARGLRVHMSVNDLCYLTRSPPVSTELVARHVETVLARETQAQEPRTRYAQPTKQATTDQTQLPNTPTDVQDVRF
ncbi:G1/S-specific cyclin-D2-like [Pieris rapae]|uniref:G1/S-specific cyclin-D2-like n=1 Tax=Pieris rapae TaxID=64459 RepID=UPI001E27CF45|nr:G1/S-specific cyclin-D2-like [Pieris rapae]